MTAEAEALTAAYVAARGCASSEALSERLLRCYRAGVAAWPSVKVSPAAFGAHLARHASPDELEGRSAAELYVACGCARGDEAAIAALQHALTPALTRALERLDAGPDVLSATWEKLLTGEPPRIAGYAGQGSLEGWVRIAAVRAAVDAQRAVRREAPLEDADLEALTTADPELAFIEATYREAFRDAFLAAIGQLSSEERNLLRLYHRDGLSIDQLGTLLGVHRATAARRLTRCREVVLERTRALLGLHLKISTATASSLVRALGVNLDLSLSQALASKRG